MSCNPPGFAHQFCPKGFICPLPRLPGMVLISGDAVATAASLVGTILVLNVFGATLALYPRPKQPGEERGLLKQSGIQVRLAEKRRE